MYIHGLRQKKREIPISFSFFCVACTHTQYVWFVISSQRNQKQIDDESKRNSGIFFIHNFMRGMREKMCVNNVRWRVKIFYTIHRLNITITTTTMCVMNMIIITTVCLWRLFKKVVSFEWNFCHDFVLSLSLFFLTCQQPQLNFSFCFVYNFLKKKHSGETRKQQIH